MKKAVFIPAVLVLLAACAFADDKGSADMKFTVIREANGKPVRNASVILHPVDGKGKQKSGGLQLKTDPDGKAELDGIPYGKLRIQVIAPGFQTYGEDFDISQPVHEITIKMQRPKEQYSIYK